MTINFTSTISMNIAYRDWMCYCVKHWISEIPYKAASLNPEQCFVCSFAAICEPVKHT
jgi:hypothetical protein